MWVRFTYSILHDKISTLERSKVVFQYQADHLGNIPCPFPLWSGEYSPDWVEGIEWWDFLEESVCLENIVGHLEIHLDLKCDPQCNVSRPHVLATHPFYPQTGQNQSTIRVKVHHLISHVPSPRSFHASSVWCQLFSNEQPKFVRDILVRINFSKNTI